MPRVFQVFHPSKVIRGGWHARTLLVAPGLSTSSKKLLVAKGIATRKKDATRVWTVSKS